jgi:uncharacterized protein
MNKRVLSMLGGVILAGTLWADPALDGGSSPSTLAGPLASRPDLPPRPEHHVIDQAGVLDGATLSAVDLQLEEFERKTSCQIVVAIYPSLPPGCQIDSYCTATFNAWGVGQKGRNNGVVLFIFTRDHAIVIRTGLGMGGVLPDAVCKNIITQVIVPALKKGDFSSGVRNGVIAMMAASKDAYQGDGSTAAEKRVK